MTVLGSGSLERTPLAYTPSATATRMAIAFRSPLSRRQRHTRYATTSRAAIAARISRADMARDCRELSLSASAAAELADERPRYRRRRPLGRGAVREEPETGGAGAAHGDAERARCTDAREGLVELGTQREGRRLKVVLERVRQLRGGGAGEGAKRLGIEPLATAANAIQFGVDGSRGQPLAGRDE